jgi:hypothetical protein
MAAEADALVLYHPPIFRGIKSITPDAACPTTLLPDLMRSGVSLLAVHTALDAAAGGTNDLLLDAFDIVDRAPLEPILNEQSSYKLVVFVPRDDVDALRSALSQAGAGVIGNYSDCGYELEGHGTFRGDETTNPAVGRKLQLERVAETRLEMVTPARGLGRVVRALYDNHRYEEPAFDLYPVTTIEGRGAVGGGRVGRLRKPRTGVALLEGLARIVDLDRACSVGDLKRRFKSVTAAAGAFGVNAFRDVDSLVLTGEFKHHDALELQKRGITAIHLEHFASEQPVLKNLRDRLAKSLRGVKFAVARKGRSPFTRVFPRS